MLHAWIAAVMVRDSLDLRQGPNIQIQKNSVKNLHESLFLFAKQYFLGPHLVIFLGSENDSAIKFTALYPVKHKCKERVFTALFWS